MGKVWAVFVQRQPCVAAREADRWRHRFDTRVGLPLQPQTGYRIVRRCLGLG